MKKQKHYYISQETINYIEEYKSKNKNATVSSALENIILEHKTNSSLTSDYVYDVISKKLSEHIKSELNSMIHSSKSADKNSQILIEIMNAFVFNTTSADFKDITTSKFTTSTLEVAKEEVENRILREKAKKSEMLL
ncbi:hypothetical protein [Romboutsia sp. MSSM.1001216sp_RTP31141st1_G3_RTP31141_220114]|uniref:hypothetical protein n=1 Tax=unclassified Romboutsia TaxID=2626894 RepID=UPI0031B620CD